MRWRVVAGRRSLHSLTRPAGWPGRLDIGLFAEKFSPLLRHPVMGSGLILVAAAHNEDGLSIITASFHKENHVQPSSP
jgi:hypothetical protein